MIPRHFFTLSLGVGALLLAAQHAFAMPRGNCAARDHVVTRLAERYGETRQSVGLGANNQVMEVYASKETGTWTITVTLPNGITCLLAAGESYEGLDEALPEAGDDA